jgi:hypothetical protein
VATNLSGATTLRDVERIAHAFGAQTLDRERYAHSASGNTRPSIPEAITAMLQRDAGNALRIYSQRTDLGAIMAMRDVLHESVQVADFVGLSMFFARHTDAMGVIVQVINIAKSRLPSPSKLNLDVFSEPESGSEYIALVATMQDYDTDSMETLNDINREIRERTGSASRHLFVTTDFASI